MPFFITRSLNLSWKQKLLLLLGLPLLPAIIRYIIAKLERKHCTLKQKLTQDSNPEEIFDLEADIQHWKKHLRLCRQNEKTFEHFFQCLVLIIATLLKTTQTGTTDLLQDLITGATSSYLLVLSAIWSIRSLITGSIFCQKVQKNKMDLYLSKGSFF